MKLKEKISIIGLGFIGLPLFVYLNDKLKNQVIGIEKKSPLTKKKFYNLQKGINPIKSNDKIFNNIVKKNSKKKLKFSTKISDISESNIIIVSVGFDLTKQNSMDNLKKLFQEIGQNVEENTLIILETTVLPGTSDEIILPVIKKEITKRKLNFSKIYYSYSFERITPGKNYISSLNSNRCFASKDKKSKNKTLSFLKQIVDTKKNQLIYFENFIDCETTKIIENSYRALNIAFIDEWVRFGFVRNLNLNKILNVIRLRNTHSNIMKTGIGVGGYCLTKDLSFGNLSNIYFNKEKSKFPLTSLAKNINQKMFKTSLDFLKLHTKLKNKKILIIGASYKEDVFDLRSSPSIDLLKSLNKYSNKIFLYDPFIESNNELKLTNKFPELDKFQIVIFVNAHKQLKNISFSKYKKNPIYFDLNNVLSDKFKKKFVKKNFVLKVLGDKK